MNGLDLPIDRYIGLDIVPELVARNQSAYGLETCARKRTSPRTLPQTDAILCRDALVHLDVARKSIRNSDAPARFGSRPPSRATMENRDIPTGEWRPLNLNARHSPS